MKNHDEALAVASDTQFGLCAGICMTSLKHATHFKRNAQAGMLAVNLPTAGVDYHVAVRRAERVELWNARARIVREGVYGCQDVLP